MRPDRVVNVYYQKSYRKTLSIDFSLFDLCSLATLVCKQIQKRICTGPEVISFTNYFRFAFQSEMIIFDIKNRFKMSVTLCIYLSILSVALLAMIFFLLIAEPDSDSILGLYIYKKRKRIETSINHVEVKMMSEIFVEMFRSVGYNSENENKLYDLYMQSYNTVKNKQDELEF